MGEKNADLEKAPVGGIRFDELLSVLDSKLKDKMAEHSPNFTNYGCKADNPDQYIISKFLCELYGDMRDILSLESAGIHPQQRFKIYHISWVQSDNYGMNAVVIAESEGAALTELDLDSSYNGEVNVSLMGECSNGIQKATIVCSESL